jgi:disulfide bond formation protein DsbB
MFSELLGVAAAVDSAIGGRALFLLPGVVLAVVARLYPRKVTLRICVTVLAFLGALSLAVFFDRRSIDWRS